ncbi:hypothetical protein AGR4C_Lc50392 [Agrobacterium tumefaciens str. Kerr 14]|uniref:Uncharacterized protein n=1 Tax=Agrobacterium tumefaciens str. Kerr 14 TaxID=1183424 RepID=A0A1S7RZF5_AGRTU|nr:hypothetical protein AGR4C_Lc50392 [Agrobacterium tumefaciens str. Kerr 14]
MGKPAPIGRRRYPVLRQIGHRIPDDAELYTGPLRDADDGDAPQNGAMITTLITGGAPALDQSFRLVKMDCGDGNTAATGNLPDRQAVFKYGIFHSGSCFRTISARKTRKHTEEQPV